MHRSYGVAAAMVVTALLVPLLLSAPAVAADDTQAPYVGTYSGQGTGTSTSGKTATATVTVWIEDAGSGSVTVTFRVDKYGLTVAGTGEVETPAADTFVIPVDLSDRLASANVILTVKREGDAWAMSGEGAGKALRREGTGTMTGVRTATGVQLPSTWKQTKDMISGILSGPPKPAASVPATTGRVTTVKPTSSLAPARPSAPIRTERQIGAMALLMLIFLFLVFGPVFGCHTAAEMNEMVRE